MFRKILAGLLALAGLAAATAGILSATVYRGSDTVTASMPAPTTPVLLIEPGVLGLVADEVTLNAQAPNDEAPIVIVSAPTYDVEAWVGPAAVTRVTGLEDWDTLAIEVTEGEATVPDPGGADIWRTETEAVGSYTAIVTPDRDPVTVMLASDGTQSAPAISLTWPVEVTTPYLIPLLVAGGVLLLAALALLFLGRKPAEARAARKAAKASAESAESPDLPPLVPGKDGVPANLTRRQLRELERQRRNQDPRLGADGPLQTTAGAIGAGVVPGVADPQRYRALRHVPGVENSTPTRRDDSDAHGSGIVPGVADPDRYRYPEAKNAGPAAGAGIVPGAAHPDDYRYPETKDAGPAAGAGILPGGPRAVPATDEPEAEAPARTSWRDLWGMKKTEEQR